MSKYLITQKRENFFKFSLFCIVFFLFLIENLNIFALGENINMGENKIEKDRQSCFMDIILVFSITICIVEKICV